MAVNISVIMPAYNVEQYIAEAIESVLQQTRLPLELIIINDGSSDGTPDVLASYANNPLVKILHQPNQGLARARNAGLARAIGEYVYFFDSDDVLRKDAVEKLEGFIEHFDGPDMVLFSGESFMDDGYETGFFPDYRRTICGLYRPEDMPGTRLLDAGCYFSSACLYVSKRRLWLENGLQFKPILHEDEEIIFPLLSAAGKIYVTDEVLFLRRIRRGSIITSGWSAKNTQAYRQIVTSLCEIYQNHGQQPFFDNKVYHERIRRFFCRYLSLSYDLGQRVSVVWCLMIITQSRMPVLLDDLLQLAFVTPLRARLKRLKSLFMMKG